MPAETGLTPKTHAVLKLNLGEKGGTRRIAFSRLWHQTNGCASYSKLAQLAIEYSYPEIPCPHDLAKYNVSVTYTDEDGDCITISTDSELCEAFLQFIGKSPPVVRADAKVTRIEDMAEKQEPKNDKAKVQDQQTTNQIIINSWAEAVEGAVAAAQMFASKPETSSTTTTGKEAILNSTPPQTKTSTQGNKTSAKFDGTETDDEESLARKIISGIKFADNASESAGSSPSFGGCSPDFIHGHHTCDRCQTKPIIGIRYHATNVPDFDLCQSCMKGHTNHSIQFCPTEFARDQIHQDRWKLMYNAQKGPKPNAADTPEPFIHGRHTCDGCLTTPIIGLRYHAENLPDYDLCSKCVKNYKGNDIQFRPVELDRDRILQHRWQRRQVRNARQARFACSSLGMHHRQACSQRNEPTDSALTEAIRRSLLDSNAARVSMKKEPSTDDLPDASQGASAEKEDIEANLGSNVDIEQEPADLVPEQSGPGEVVDLMNFPTADGQVLATLSKTDQDASPDPPTLESESAKRPYSEEAASIGTAAEAIGATLDSCAQAIDAIVSEFEKADKSSLHFQDEQVADAVAVASAVSSHGDSSYQQQGSVDASGTLSALTSSVPTLGDVVVDDSAGSADVDGTAADTAISEGESKGEGAPALEEDEWEVIGRISSEEALARATGFLRSTLFESDVQNAPGPPHPYDSSGAASGTASTVAPAIADAGTVDADADAYAGDVPNPIPLADDPCLARERWGRWHQELSQLRDLGFRDDGRNAEALNRLEAANRGVAGSSPVTVTDAVDFLLAQQQQELLAEQGQE